MLSERHFYPSQYLFHCPLRLHKELSAVSTKDPAKVNVQRALLALSWVALSEAWSAAWRVFWA
jgi:hypothetical protein